MRITKYKVNVYYKGKFIDTRLYGTKEEALGKVSNGLFTKEYDGEASIELYCANCEKWLKLDDTYLKVDEETRYCQDCYEEETLTYYTVGKELVGDENETRTYNGSCREVLVLI